LGQSGALLWLAYCAFHQGFHSSFCIYIEQALKLISQQDYQFLLTRSTMLGSDHPVDFIPLLLEARNQSIQSAFVQQILKDQGIDSITYHPGYTLRIQTLGAFNVWLGRKELSAADWKREKSRQLLQVLVGNYGKWLHRDQITVILWPDADPKTASNNLKVSLSTLNQVLEPNRQRNDTPYFILRRADQYMLNPPAGILIDALQFDEQAHAPELSKLTEAAMLYRGRYFENNPIQEYFIFEEQYYHELYLHLMDKLIQNALDTNAYEQALDYAHALVTRDPLWEPAYRNLMRIYARMGNRSMVLQVYQQCQEALYRQLGSSVSSETRALAEELTNEK
jgi:DNA-binding SARP family transcriptional activator